MTVPAPSRADVDAAIAMASRGSRRVNADSAGVAELAFALSVLDRLEDGQDVADAVVRAAHDGLYAGALRHVGKGCLRRLAVVLVGRGVVPWPWEYDGQWPLWWPKDGRGPCGACGRARALRRYSGRYARPYRYLCDRCRTAEREQDAEHARRLREQADTGPLGAVFPPASAAASGAAGVGLDVRPAGEDWGRHVERVHELLFPLERAGFDLPEEWDCEFDPQQGAVMWAETWRGDGALSLRYEPQAGALILDPFQDETGEWPMSYSLTEDSIRIPVTPTGEDAVTAVARAAGRAGLLDATHVRIADGTPPDAAQEFALHRIRAIFQPAADYRDLSLADVLGEVTEDSRLTAYLEWVVGMAGAHVAPDVVPDAAALGVAAWCWRNNTAVEDHHLDTDVLMARVNIAVTRITLQHVDPYEGIDWQSIGSALTDPVWALPDGTTISSLFGEGWSEVAATVTAELARWQRLEDEVLGPRTVMILMTIGGSTSYTRSWWGQGRWSSMCQQVIQDATHAALTLPPPYHSRGAHALLTDLQAPDHLPDHVLDWLIDLPDAGTDGPRGLRSHPVTTPQQRCWDPYWLTGTPLPPSEQT